jgi:hypothetical protein
MSRVGPPPGLPRREGLYNVGDKYYRVVELFDMCTERHEEISKDICRKIKGCVYMGDCYIVYQYNAELGRAVMKAYAH